jgi:hypothetical protein
MLLREWFDDFWHDRSFDWAGAFLDEWCVQVMRSRLEPMKKVARMLRRHRPLLLNWFRARGQISAAIVEGFNNTAKLTTRKAYGFRSYRCLERPVPHVGSAPGTGSDPQILLKTRIAVSAGTNAMAKSADGRSVCEEMHVRRVQIHRAYLGCRECSYRYSHAVLDRSLRSRTTTWWQRHMDRRGIGRRIIMGAPSESDIEPLPESCIENAA